MPPVPQLTVAPPPPKLTVKGELLAAKPPLWLAPQLTWLAPAPMARVKLPSISKTASFPAVVLVKIKLPAPRLLTVPKVKAVPAATVSFTLKRMWVGSRIAAIVAPPVIPVPLTVWPMTRPLLLETHRSVPIAIATATVDTPLVDVRVGMSCARRTPC